MTAMERFHSILANIWREACRHIEIEQSAASFARMLDQHLPLGQLVFCRLEPEHRRLVTVALAPPGNGQPAVASPTPPCSEREWQRLLAWASDDGMAGHGSGQGMPAALRHLLGDDSGVDMLTAALRVAGGPVGLVHLIAKPRHQFNDKHVEILQAIQEPLAVALDNDRRLHEMAALREAAEADKRSL